MIGKSLRANVDRPDAICGIVNSPSANSAAHVDTTRNSEAEGAHSRSAAIDSHSRKVGLHRDWFEITAVEWNAVDENNDSDHVRRCHSGHG